MKKVLVVDDTKNIRLLLTKCLELEGYEVMAACDGKEALELLQNNNFDLAFLDIKLPEIRGTEVLKRIRDSGNNTPIIIITAYATVKNAVDCTQLGAVAYIQKPFSIEKIKSVLAELNYKPPGSIDNFSEFEKILNKIRELINNHSYGKALPYLKKAISEEPANAELFLLFGKAYEGIGNKDLSEKFYETYKIFNNSRNNS